MGGKKIDFNDKKNQQKDFHKNKKLFKVNEIDINKILISKLGLYGQNNGKKYIIGYSDDVIRPLCIKLPQMIGYLNIFKDNNKTTSFLADDKELLKEYFKVWEKLKT